MTTPSTIRAAEIIAAYGGDPARWPDGERAATDDAIARSPDLADVLAAARVLDADLSAWAQAPIEGGDAAAALAGLQGPALRLRAARGGWAAGGAMLAASVAAALWLVPAPHGTATTAIAASDDAAAFAELFTPTPDEELIL